ncbi:unnamed protein product [Amoebophrya sp. A120]|nr:unnamed protein product [Amoebophrya sp. A120]|eukprot:GSA120T00008138001.1
MIAATTSTPTPAREDEVSPWPLSRGSCRSSPSQETSASSIFSDDESDDFARPRDLSSLLRERSEAARLVRQKAFAARGITPPPFQIDGSNGRILSAEGINPTFRPENLRGENQRRQKLKQYVILNADYLCSLCGPADSIGDYLQARSHGLATPDVHCKCYEREKAEFAANKAPGGFRGKICSEKASHLIERSTFLRYVRAEASLLKFFKPKLCEQYRTFIVLTLANDFCMKCHSEKLKRAELAAREEKSGLEQLPFEVVNKVSTFLTVAELLTLSQTCKSLRSDLYSPLQTLFEEEQSCGAPSTCQDDAVQTAVSSGRGRAVFVEPKHTGNYPARNTARRKPPTSRRKAAQVLDCVSSEKISSSTPSVTTTSSSTTRAGSCHSTVRGACSSSNHQTKSELSCTSNVEHIKTMKVCMRPRRLFGYYGCPIRRQTRRTTTQQHLGRRIVSVLPRGRSSSHLFKESVDLLSEVEADDNYAGK